MCRLLAELSMLGMFFCGRPRVMLVLFALLAVIEYAGKIPLDSMISQREKAKINSTAI